MHWLTSAAGHSGNPSAPKTYWAYQRKYFEICFLGVYGLGDLTIPEKSLDFISFRPGAIKIDHNSPYALIIHSKIGPEKEMHGARAIRTPGPINCISRQFEKRNFGGSDQPQAHGRGILDKCGAMRASGLRTPFPSLHQKSQGARGAVRPPRGR